MYNLYHFVSLIIKESQVSVCRHPSRKIDSPTIFGAIMLSVFLLLSGPASALVPGTLPTGGKITSGKGSIYSSGNQMTVKQDTRKMIANWDTFNIGKSAGVAFKQPDADSVALNRIYDQNPSQILGSLSAKGKVFLLNPSGIVFGKDAQINVGGLVASSLNMADSDFLAGKYNFFSDGQSGSILNQGNISVIPGGVVALIAPKVTNEGTITATSGDVLMAAGNQVSLDFNGDGLINYTINKGAINALAENKGLIQTDGGLVVMTAEAADSLTGAVVNNSGVIQAQTLQNKHGRIVLLSDIASGTTIVGGTLDASAPNGGNGGFIETSAANVKVNDEAMITTLAPKGKTGTWLIDPNDFTISATGDMTGVAVSSALSTNNFEIATTSMGTDGGSGNIYVNENVTWSAPTQLKLTAENEVHVNNTIENTNTTAGGVYFNAPNAADKVIFDASKGKVIIHNVEQLQWMNTALAGIYALGSDIDTSDTVNWNAGSGFAPIGDNSTGSNASRFTGTFNGLNHTISNLTINRPAQDFVGLFGYKGSGSAISNVGLVGGSVSGGSYVGGLVGNSSGGSISNAYATGSVTGSNDSVGGLVGGNSGLSTISNAYATGSVSGGSYVGGLVGWKYFGVINNYYATGNVSGVYGNVGGLVGRNNNGSITNAYATGRVAGGSWYVGGWSGLTSRESLPTPTRRVVSAVVHMLAVFSGITTARCSKVTGIWIPQEKRRVVGAIQRASPD
jgi:filamentous hemagglutinin family protein